jgi:hypothetical protein
MTNDLPSVFCWVSQMAITNHLATVFWLLSGMAITNDLVGVVCQLSQMASSFTSRFISSFTRGQRADYCVPLLGICIKDAQPRQHLCHQPSALSTLSFALGQSS